MSGGLIAIAYFVVAFIVAVAVLRRLHAHELAEVAKSEFHTYDGEARVWNTLGAVCAGVAWPLIVLGYAVWRVAFPPRVPPTVEDERHG